MFRTYVEALIGFRRFAAWSVLLLVTSGLAEALGIAALLPLLSSNLTRKAGGHSEWFGLSGNALTLASVGALVGLGLFAAWLRYLGDNRSYVLSAAVEQSLRSRMAAALLGMRWTDYLPLTLGEGIKSVLIEANQVGVGTLALVQALGNATIAAVFVAIALVVSPVMTAAVLVFGLVTALLYRRAGQRAQELSRGLSAQSGELAESTTDLLSNAKFYRSTGLSNRALARVDAQFANWARYYVRTQRYLPATRLGFDSAGLLFIGGVLVVSLVTLGNSLAAALVFLALFYRLAPRLQTAQQAVLQARTQAAWWHTWKRQYDAALAATDPMTGTVRFDNPPVIQLDGVRVTYPQRTVPALSSVSCTIAPGGCVGVVGESGGGKTTLLDVVTGLLRPTSGAIRLDGHDLAEVDLQTWRGHIGLVMQESPVFHATVLENIAWSDEQPDLDRATRAADMANLTDVIEALPEGLYSQVGQKGGRLSGGQRQRLALARALYREPWLLILDEATSALDSESEQVIQAALASLRGSCSMLVVAHRLKTVQIADHIVVLSAGRVVDEGSWDELSAREGVFRRMLAAQATEPVVSSS